MSTNTEPAPLQALNPFVPGAGRSPQALVGREGELEIVDRMLARIKLGLSNQGIIYRGLRGVGKTVLLMKLYDMACDKGMAAGIIESSGDAERDYEALFSAISKAIIRVRDGGLRQRLSAAFAHVESISLEFLGTKISVGLGQKDADDRALSQAYRLELLVEELAEELRKDNLGLLLFIDEFQEMASSLMGTLITLQHQMGQRGLPFYIIGAGLPDLPGLLAKSRSYAERLFDYRTIGSLSDEQAAEGFQKPAAMIGRKFSAAAIARLVELSQGYPYFIQAYGEATWNASESSPIPLSAVNAGEPVARAALDRGLYASRWQRATPSGRAYLSALSAFGDAPCESAQVAERLGKTTAEVSVVRQSLIQLGLIYSPEYGKIAFTVPGMADFIQRNAPAEDVSYDGRH